VKLSTNAQGLPRGWLICPARLELAGERAIEAGGCREDRRPILRVCVP
jgi:hypothetical protein